MTSRRAWVIILLLPIYYVLVNFLTFLGTVSLFEAEIDIKFSVIGRICVLKTFDKETIIFNNVFLAFRTTLISLLMLLGLLTKSRITTQMAFNVSIFDLACLLTYWFFYKSVFYVDIGFSNRYSNYAMMQLVGQQWRIALLFIYTSFALVGLYISKRRFRELPI